MENRSEHLLLTSGFSDYGTGKALLLACSLAIPQWAMAQDSGDSDKPAPVQVIAPEVKPRSIQEADIDAEFFEVGVFAGIMSIDNFSSEPLLGVSAAFHATEDFFLQFNYGFTEAGLTSFEELSGNNVRLLNDSDRDFSYYDFLVGYNIFPGEVFFSDSLTFNSAFYLVGGVGNTEFGGESNFTTTLGTGFRVVLLDWLTVHVDFRDHMFTSDLIRESQLTHNIELSSGFTLFF
ncbi:outer membrane beta-barrel domain-containing protein [Marinobacter panjinensis]|uniref:Outer membrane beta-barrel domain-containing protein n=1 Tax=Marinobacter panjinensis TaxID=2576384 RepID=A0A4U6R3X2_9GAMM|nr:outer membrane beta-barrel domain-containing protein [Marinobacter panjinensis]MCR8916178.1 outer membrane beta-barrel domain-containing protein [Marinobacter panjinensis]TKV68350.1 outer membrane beta-barrel domain-containing protein [Marinobacter panjinensis]